MNVFNDVRSMFLSNRQFRKMMYGNYRKRRLVETCGVNLEKKFGIDRKNDSYSKMLGKIQEYLVGKKISYEDDIGSDLLEWSIHMTISSKYSKRKLHSLYSHSLLSKIKSLWERVIV